MPKPAVGQGLQTLLFLYRRSRACPSAYRFHFFGAMYVFHFVDQVGAHNAAEAGSRWRVQSRPRDPRQRSPAQRSQHTIMHAQILNQRIARRRSNQSSPAVASESRFRRDAAAGRVGVGFREFVRMRASVFGRCIGGVFYIHFCTHGNQ
jgi:hypothetical protein